MDFLVFTEMKMNTEMICSMNDDITMREVELVRAILSALKENEDIFILKAIDSDVDRRLRDFQEGFVAGYQDALEVISDTLQRRGFEIKWVAEKVGRNYDHD